MRILQRCNDFLESKIRPNAWLWALGRKIQFQREFGNCLLYVGPYYLGDLPFSISLCWDKREAPAEYEMRFSRELLFVCGAPTIARIFDGWESGWTDGVSACSGHLRYLPYGEGQFRARNWTGRACALRFSWPIWFRSRRYHEHDHWRAKYIARPSFPRDEFLADWIGGELTAIDLDYIAGHGRAPL